MSQTTNLYACKGMPRNAACIKQIVGAYEISASFDDSCGVLSQMSRGDIRVYRVTDDADVTSEFFPNMNVVIANIENLAIAYNIATTK